MGEKNNKSSSCNTCKTRATSVKKLVAVSITKATCHRLYKSGTYKHNIHKCGVVGGILYYWVENK